MLLKRCFRMVMVGVEASGETVLSYRDKRDLGASVKEILRHFGMVSRYSIYLNVDINNGNVAQFRTAAWYMQDRISEVFSIDAPIICQHDFRIFLTEPKPKPGDVIIVVVPTNTLDQVLSEVNASKNFGYGRPHYFKVEMHKSWLKPPKICMTPE